VALYPLAMGFTLIYTGEHYFSDVALGFLYAIVAAIAGRAILRWWLARRALQQPSIAPQPAYSAAEATSQP
jgi:membrane-associated phospholipid phosphatase